MRKLTGTMFCLQQQGYANVVSAPDVATAGSRLLSGEADLLAVSAITHAGPLAAAGIDDSRVERACAFSTEKPSLAFSAVTDDAVVADWRQALDALKRDGTCAERCARYLSGEIPIE